MCLLFDFSPSPASRSVNAILNHPDCKLLSLLTVITHCLVICHIELAVYVIICVGSSVPLSCIFFMYTAHKK